MYNVYITLPTERQVEYAFWLPQPVFFCINIIWQI